MSFITKRERVFNEYDLFDLPARNEGKLKTYASCTDARAWSHFCSDKSEHLVEIIKRNNETVRTKYIPTDVIVNMLMSVKNAEIGRLKRKIEEFEQMISAYDQLDLTCEQKCDIATAHAAIKAANKELDDMCLDLDLSGYTEGIDSEAFETGKSRGDEPSRYGIIETGKSGGGEQTKIQGEEWSFDKEKVSTPRKVTKSSQAGPPCTCDASTSAHDPQVDEMQETIIYKDAKLSAMQNTIAVMEHDVCEPYCIYAHIYTALEKIFGTLCQNAKYKQYLDLLTAGKDTRGIDIKGKILFKMKVLEKFSLALIAPCSQEFSRASQDCSCLRAEVVTTFALTSAESQIPTLDNKRAQLVADIMENREMQEILSSESLCLKIEDDQFDECFGIDNCSIEVANLNRLKNLQANYDELLTCYDNLKHEKDCLYLRCQKIADLEHECDCLKNNLKEYNELWKEKEYYRKRSEDLDTLKENYYILSEETSNVETKLNAEQEINKIKCQTIDQLRNENLKLEKKISDVSVLFEKQKNGFICKLKECECKMMCQDQQIKSLSDQIDTLLEGDRNKVPPNEETLQSVQLIDEIESQKDQIKNLKDDLCCSEEEKQYLQEEFEKKLEVINELKLDVEDWKNRYEETLRSYNYLQMQVDELQGKNSLMNQELENKSNAIDNLNNIICSKSHEIGNLIDEVDHKNVENINLIKQIKNNQDSFDKNIALLKNEKKIAMSSIITAKEESIEFLKHFKDHDDRNKIRQSINNISDILNTHENIDDNIFIKEIELLRGTNLENINILYDENEQLKKTYDLAKKESLILEQKLINQDNLLATLEMLKQSHENILNEKETIQGELTKSISELEKLQNDFQVSTVKSQSLLDESEDIKEEHAALNIQYQKVLHERNMLQKSISDKDSEINILIHSLQSLKLENEQYLLKIQEIPKLQETSFDLKSKCEKLLSEKNTLQCDLNIKTKEINTLYDNVETKKEEIQRLQNQIKTQQSRELSASGSISNLRNENYNIQLNLDAVRNESVKLLDKIKKYEKLENQHKELQALHEQIQLENVNLQKEVIDLNKMLQENYSKKLEEALVRSREENISKACSLEDFYTDLKTEVEKLKQEKLKNHIEMKNVLEKLDESEYIITNLNEEILAREKKISTLENHINELQVEIIALQNDLKDVVESGEQLKELSYEKLDQTVKKIEAHQSRATHNMKLEFTKLQNENEKLEDQLSTTRLISEESFKETNMNVSLIKQLQNERELIISDIKQLEINSIGDSNLLPSKSSVNEVITSLHRIGKYIDSKNTSLEQTLLNIQASYQLLKSKAEEAKIIAENEQQKIIYEKEQAKKEREGIEKHLNHLKAKAKEEKVNYEKVIKDLEGEMLNQKLILDKINQSKESNISKLIEENQLLRVQCENYETDIKELEQKFQYESEQKSNNLGLIEKTNKALENKDKMIVTLQNQIDALKNKQTQPSCTQTEFVTIDNNCQTDKYEHEGSVQKSFLNANSMCENVKIINKNVDASPISEISNEKKLLISQNISDPMGPSINEVQILTANIEPKIDFVKNIYLKYKIKRLSLGNLEQHSITGLQEATLSNGNDQGLIANNELFSVTQVPESFHSRNFPSQNFHSQLKLNNDSTIDNIKKLNSTKIAVGTTNDQYISPTSDLENYNPDFENIISIRDFKKENNSFHDSFPVREKDLFVIYKDSMYDGQKKIKKVRATGVKERARQGKANQLNVEETIYISANTSDNIEDDSIKQKLSINLPRVIDVSPSFMTSSDDDKKSLDSFGTPQLDSEKTSIQQYFINHSENDIQSDGAKVEALVSKKTVFSNESNHNLPRIGAKILVLKNSINDSLDKQSEDFNVKSNYGLQYILNTMQNEINPNNMNKLNLIKPLRKSHSVETFINISESSRSKRLSPLKMSSSKFGTTSNYSPQFTNSVDRATLVKFDDIEDFENKIHKLTTALENIEKQYKKKIESVKMQYDSNVQCIINEHNHGVKSIQNLHEETLQDIKKIHENEVENLRSMSIEAMRKAEKLQVENRCLKSKFNYTQINLNNLTAEPSLIPSSDSKKRKCRCRVNSRTLTKTNVEAFNVKPKRKGHGPCTCSLDINISDTIRSIFEQVDVDQRKMAEQVYLKYIAKKILESNVEILDARELSFLHLEVCRTWKTKLNSAEAKQIKIDSLETELINKQRQTEKHMAEWDRKVAEEWQRLQEVSEAVCFSPNESRDISPTSPTTLISTAEKDVCSTCVGGRRSAGDLTSGQCAITSAWKRKRGKLETNRAVVAKLDGCGGRREKVPFIEETPTRLRRAHDRHKTHKK
ncbi:uncharacterized protein PFB0765w-like [Pararge aegeria]|uniref:uncharacterized protein PFB0765w-like n=1 Tax=Pararge aegeria TaxID=116150 RepID=UPI0019D00F55|nr:uncharacterized protein PFB0765w-like [Pararge aegeria]